MRWEILSRETQEFDECAFKDFARLCGDENVTPFLGAAVTLIEDMHQISLRPMRVLAYCVGGETRLPFRKIDIIESVQLVSGHGVPMNTHAPKVSADKICLPSLQQCGDCNASYHVKYRTKPVEISDLVVLAVNQVALDLYDGNQPRDVSSFLSGVAPGKMAMMLDAVGGINRKLI